MGEIEFYADVRGQPSRDEYIDGDADKYVQAGVVKTLTSDYRWKNQVDATVDVYIMGNAAGAQNIYDSESAVGASQSPLATPAVMPLAT